jgi:putative transposase
MIAEWQSKYRHQEFLRFLERIDTSVDSALDIHVVLDNYGTHKHPEVKAWLGERPRYHLHFTPASSSWLIKSNAGSPRSLASEFVEVPSAVFAN